MPNPMRNNDNLKRKSIIFGHNLNLNKTKNIFVINHKKAFIY